MRTRSKVAVLVSVLASATVIGLGSASAEDAKASPPDADGVRRDPKGITGVSPFWEKLKAGDDAVIAGDMDAAMTAYEAAIKEEPQNFLGHTRAAQVLMLKGEFDPAFERLERALGFAKRVEQRAKVMFLQAEIQERKTKFAQAKRQWETYEKFTTSGEATSDKEAAKKIYPATAKERLKQIKDREQRDKDYAEVKERIQKREKELDDKAHGK